MASTRVNAELILSESVMRKMRYPRFFYGCLALLLAFSSAFSYVANASDEPLVAASINVQKSENDQRHYRYLVLPNQLKVLLISDPETEKSAASLDVAVGANQNPPEREGLAHFLEHMLFLGTEKYPQAGEYQTFVAQHGGTYNAYTAAENTNYFFDIENAHLEPALDRFAQFFITPLFTANYVERERNAVHSEYVAKLKDDARKEWDVYRALMNPANPSALFTVGNNITLGDRPDTSLRDELLVFYQRYYSAHLMSLVVLGRDNLDQLEALVRQRFVQVPQHNVEFPTAYPALFTEGFLPASVDIKPEKELRQLAFNFPIPNPDALYTYKPYDYIGHLLGHEGKGSLLALLKRLGWAETLYAGITIKNRHQAVFQINLNLTPEGVVAREQIVSLIFHALDQLRSRGLNQWRYEELKQLADMSFRFLEKEPPATTVSRLSALMKTYAPEDILRGDYIYKDYQQKQIEKSLDYLRPNNLLLVFSAPDVQAFRVTNYYTTPFTLRRYVPDIAELKPAIKAELSLPEKNIFIPGKLIVKSTSMLEEKNAIVVKAPQLIVDNKFMQSWFLQDRVFLQPKATINLRIKSPLVAADVDGAASAQLFVELINDQLTDITYPATLAGLSSSFNANPRGFDVEISGYSARQGLLLDKIVAAIKSGHFNAGRYDNIKQDLLRRLKNERKNLPFQVLARQVPVLQYDPYWSNDALIAALEAQTQEQFSRFATRVLIDAKIDALFYGNYFRSEALKLSALIEHELLGRQTGREMPIAKVLLLPKGLPKPWLYTQTLDHPDKVVELFIQSPSVSIADAAHMQLIRQILQPNFFNELRTEKQLGYIVAAIAMPLRTLETSIFVVQSPTTTEAQLIAEIDQFLSSQTDTLQETFVQNQASLVKKLQEPPRSHVEQADRYWDALMLGDHEFSRRADLAAAVSAITIESLTAYYKGYFLQKNRRLWLSSAGLKKRDNYRVVENIADYKQQLEIIALP